MTEKTDSDYEYRSFYMRPQFYLLYLLFYFVPWFFRTPGWTDLLAALIGISVFLPVYFRVFEESSLRYLPHILVIEAIGFMLAPFNGMHGTFHIYAMAQAGFQRPTRHAYYIFTLLSAIYVGGSLLIGMPVSEVAFVAGLGAIIGAGCIASAQQIEHSRFLERSLAVDRQLATIEERDRIAHDLHDLLGHTLTMVALKAEVAMKMLDRDKERARHEIGEIRSAARRALGEVRETLADMSATSIEIELAAAREMLDSAGIIHTVSGDPPRFDPGKSRVIGMCLREAVTNVIRHSGAGTVRIAFERAGESCRVSIVDDGQGVSASAGAASGSGLSGIRRRLEGLGGSLAIDTALQGGTCLEFRVPAQAMPA